MWKKLLAFLHIYWYQFQEKTVYASYLEEARNELFNPRSQLIDTNDPSVI